MDLTREQVINYLNNSEPVRLFYRHATEIGFYSDFPDHEIENFILSIKHSSISDVETIDKILNDNKDVLRKYIAHIYANRKLHWRVTPGFLCELVLIVKFPNKFTKDVLIEKGWADDVASIIISSAEIFSRKIN